MPNEVDKAIDDAQVQLRRILTGIRLEPEEKEFVNAAAPRLERLTYEIANELPEQKRWAMRPVVLAVAIGMIIAPALEARRGADMFSPK